MNLHSSDRGLSRAALGILAAATLGTLGYAQTNAVPSRFETISFDTGVVRNSGSQVETVAVFHVSQPGAEWMRVHFDSAILSGSIRQGEATIIKLTSLHDGYFQYLNAKTLEEWQNISAYFNGDLVQVEVIAHPGTGPNQVSVNHVEIGLRPPEGLDTICGVDNRVASADPRSARLMPIGCTSFLIDDACGCFGTAGHCIGGSVVQFNVPLSNGNGSTNNPPPQDQYAVDVTSRQSRNGGQGNDWGYFGCFPNSTSGLTPLQAQGSTYTLTTPPSWNSNLDVRITGYGVDGGTANQTQQTHVGPWLSPSGNLLSYQADTQGGNSGSPVVQEQSGVCMGVHTHGGCSGTTTGSNKGTSRTHPGWIAALSSPKGVCAKGAPSCSTVPVASIRNGSGVNPVCLTNLTDPALGTAWNFAVDVSQVPGGNASVVRARRQGSAPISTAFGENLLNEGSKLIFTRTGGGTGINTFTVNVPANLEFAGFTGSIQGLVLGGDGPLQFCNAIDFVIGCEQ